MTKREARAVALGWVASNAGYLAETFTGEIEDLSEKDVSKVADQIEEIGREMQRRSTKLSRQPEGGRT